MEFIGDSFLKLATSVRLYCHRKQLGAGDLHLLRQSQISNDNLYRIGLTISLPQIMCTQVFDPSENWSPLRCVADSRRIWQPMEKKWVADAVESLTASSSAAFAASSAASAAAYVANDRGRPR